MEILLAATTASATTLTIHNFIGSHMVLAREPLSARVWGNASSGATVTVTLAGVGTTSATTSANGSWMVDLPPQKAGTDHTLTFSDGTSSITITDVAFGDVRIQFPVRHISRNE